MGSTLSQIRSLPEGPTLAQLPFFPEDGVDDLHLPPRPSSVCHACWEGPFAMHFGLPCMSPGDGQWYRRWPEEISYSITLEKMESRADSGCVWCLLLLPASREVYYDPGATGSPSLNITVRGTAEKWRGWGQKYQRLDVEINGDRVFQGLVYTTADGPAAYHITTRTLILDVGSRRALVFARQHIDECTQEHECCKVLAGSLSPYLPTRLVECTNLARPRLVSTANGARGEYLALSYVWGEEQPHKTTAGNASTYERGIELSILPKTIQDAIYVTHMLGFRFLWVDTLCIVQDDDVDRRHELGHMHNIYRYARLSIIAASAERVSEGFLHERPPPPRRNSIDDFTGGEVVLPFICPSPRLTSEGRQDDHPEVQSQIGEVHLTSIHSEERSSSANLGLISTRAWCMQEYLLSPRSLIFTPRTLQFRCLTAMQGVGNSLCATYKEPRIPSALFLPVPRVATSGSKEWKTMRRAWMEIVQDYSGRRTSVESDKLVACAAVAEQFHRVLGSEYLAGLWRSDTLLIELLWEADKVAAEHGRRHTRPTTYRAPSWSWAAVQGTVRHRFTWPSDVEDTPGNVALAKIVECRVTLEDSTLPFGRVTGGVLVLRGTPILCYGAHASRTLTQTSWTVPLPSLEQVRRQKWGLGGSSDNEDEAWSIELSGERCATVTFDCELEADQIRKMWIVPFVRTKYQWIRGHDLVHGAVIELTSSSNSSEYGEKVLFQRIGYFYSTFIKTYLGETNTEHPLWDPLTEAMEDGEGLELVEITII